MSAQSNLLENLAASTQYADCGMPDVGQVKSLTVDGTSQLDTNGMGITSAGMDTANSLPLAGGSTEKSI